MTFTIGHDHDSQQVHGNDHGDDHGDDYGDDHDNWTLLKVKKIDFGWARGWLGMYNSKLLMGNAGRVGGRVQGQDYSTCLALPCYW